jgi:hypothetical protein
MSIDELIAEYEQNTKIILTERERFIFQYAYTVGKKSLDKKS